ncbi:MAG: FAD-dependent oxidoreductase [Fusobacterium sp.]
MKKILIVGGVAGGASAAARLRRHSEEDQIIMFEKGPHVSFSNCCLPYHLGGTIKEAEDLVLMSPEKFIKQYNIEARINNEVISIDRDSKNIRVKNTLTGKEYNESYDKLILSPGAKPIVPNIPGIEKINHFSIRNVTDIDNLNKFIKSSNSRNISVIGGGVIGVETCENLKEAGYNVTLIEAANQIMKPFDYDMVQILHKELVDKGINLIVEDKVCSFENKNVILESGKKINADTIIMAIGVLPETELAKNSGLELGPLGGIKTDSNYMTNDENIYAVGDAIEVYGALFNDYFKLPLAGPAQKQARSVADHINGMKINNKGFIGSSVIKVFDYNGASTGLTEEFIKMKKMNIHYNVIWAIPGDGVGLMPSSNPLHFKLIYEVPSGRILGAQAIGKGNVDKRIDVIATGIKLNATIDDLKDLELCYAPPFGTAKDVVNFGGYIASNLLNGDYKQISFSKVRNLVEENAYIIDVREKDEFELSHIINAKNIPLSEFRERINEIPKDIPVYLHCRSGQRSYNAALIMENLGFKNSCSIAGGFMGLSFYEYFNDLTLNRPKIVTGYNFD